MTSKGARCRMSYSQNYPVPKAVSNDVKTDGGLISRNLTFAHGLPPAQERSAAAMAFPTAANVALHSSEEAFVSVR